MRCRSSHVKDRGSFVEDDADHGRRLTSRSGRRACHAERKPCATEADMLGDEDSSCAPEEIAEDRKEAPSLMGRATWRRQRRGCIARASKWTTEAPSVGLMYGA